MIQGLAQSKERLCYSPLIAICDMFFLFFRGADANKNTNADDIEMKTNLVDNRGEPVQSEP